MRTIESMVERPAQFRYSFAPQSSDLRFTAIPDKGKQEQTMAKKNTSSRKSIEEPSIAGNVVSDEVSEAPEPEMTTSPASATLPSKQSKVKAIDDPATGSVGLSDIRKAVAFANSVGGLDKAIALLQIVKVAKEVQ